MGLSVNDTNIEIMTAKATVRPNGQKKRPTMPLVMATGRNTATMDRVVASTARPISAVPKSAAWRAGIPASTWRMMFSCTTMASSMSMPIASVSAISVIMFSVNPMAYMRMKVESTAVGRTRALMNVLR